MESFSLLPPHAITTRHATERFDLQQRLHVSESDISGKGEGREGGIESPRYGAERIVHGAIDALAIPEPGFTWPGDLLTLHVKYVGARPRTTKMRGGMIYNGVMGSRDDTAVIVAPRGIIAMPDLGLPSRRARSRYSCFLEKSRSRLRDGKVVEERMFRVWLMKL